MRGRRSGKRSRSRKRETVFGLCGARAFGRKRHAPGEPLGVARLIVSPDGAAGEAGGGNSRQPLTYDCAGDDVRARTEASPFARAFFTLVEGLGVVEPSGLEVER